MLAGVLPVFQTPYMDDESIDWETLSAEIDWLLAGASGVVMAMVSEVLRLSTDSHRAMAQHVCRQVAGRGAIVISVGAESRHTAVSLATHAEECGATALMAIPPVSTAAPDEAMAYYRAVLAAVRIPLIVQDASAYVGRPLPITMQARLLDEHGPDRVLFKPEAAPLGPNLTALHAATGGPAGARGERGRGAGGQFSPRHRRHHARGGPDRRDRGPVAGTDGRRRAAHVSALATDQGTGVLATGLDGYLAMEKYLLVKQGVFHNTHVRGPVAFRLDDETRAEIDRLFEMVCQAVADNAG